MSRKALQYEVSVMVCLEKPCEPLISLIGATKWNSRPTLPPVTSLAVTYLITHTREIQAIARMV